jgi:hypothetical protein
MNNKDYQEILQAHNIRLARIDSQKKFVENMIKDLEKQFTVLCDDWEETWRIRQDFKNEHGELEASV